jgi:NRAMP (natural resistance-associated macrophage protein)-like metal ion transporter
MMERMDDRERTASPGPVERAFEAPAKMLDGAAEAFVRGEKQVISKIPLKRAEEYWETLGPGLTTGAADNDPSGIVTYSEAGARYGFQLLWMPLFTLPFMAATQEMCARIGLVSGRGLAANIRRHHSAPALYTVTALLFLANALNIAANLGAMAAATRLIWPGLHFQALIIAFAAASLLLQVFTTYARYAKYLKYLTLTLFSYVIVAFAAHLDWGAAFSHTFVPSLTFSRDQIFLIAAVLGTTISPYLFFWQTSQEVEEEELAGEKTIAARRAGTTWRTIRTMRIDVWSGMFFSNLIAFFIFITCAGTLYASGVTNIETAEQAAEALRPFGELAYLFFAFGIVGTGLLSVPVLAGSSAYAFAESFGWRSGLYRKLKQAYAFYGVIIVSMLLGILANLLRLDPIKGLLWAAVANALIAPVVLYFVMRLSTNPSVMGEHVNRPLTSVVGWTTVALMALSGVAALATFL